MLDVSTQEVITRDNVSAKVNAGLYWGSRPAKGDQLSVNGGPRLLVTRLDDHPVRSIGVGWIGAEAVLG